MTATADAPLRGGGRTARGWRNPRRRLVVAAVLPLALLAAWGVIYGPRLAAPGTGSGASIGDHAPELAMADLDGNPVRLSDLRGKPVIVNFWASWCGPCVEEFPLLVDARQRYAGEGLTIIGVVFRDSSVAARDFMARMGAGWQAAMDPDERVAASYGIFGPPETFFIDRDGVVAGRQIGQLSAADLDRQLAEIVRKEESP